MREEERRELVLAKYNGRCAYSGTILERDWQIDHWMPIGRIGWNEIYRHPERENIDNLVPAQKLINHHKKNLLPEEYKHKKLKNLHKFLLELPRQSYSERQIRRKNYYLQIADYFDIRIDKPFDMSFYYEKFDTDIR